MEALETNLANNVRFLREREGFDQCELAKRLGISQVQVTFVENGHRGFSVKRLAQVSELFGVTIDDLLFADLAKEKVAQ